MQDITLSSIGAMRKMEVQYFLRGTIGDTVYPKGMWHGGTNYPRISCMGVPKRGGGGVRITVIPDPFYLHSNKPLPKFITFYLTPNG